MPSQRTTKLSSRDCKKYFNRLDDQSWASFDEYADHIDKIHYVKYDKKAWTRSICSCEHWAKNYFCHHVIGLAETKAKVQYTDVHRQIPIGQNRKRGQPKKTKGALERQMDYMSSSSSSSESSDEDTYQSPVKTQKKSGAKQKSAKKVRKA